jgi:hypothetical protein
VSLAVLSLVAAAAPAASAAPSQEPTECQEGHFCLYEGPHQTGRILFDKEIVRDKVQFLGFEMLNVDPVMYPRSAHYPQDPEGYSCIVSLNELPNYKGEEQQVDGSEGGNHELTGAPVASMFTDCG